MSRKLLYFVGLSCTVIVIIASILHTLNPADVEVKPWYGYTWKTSTANIMIGYFLLGGVLVGLIAIMLEAQRALQIKLLRRQDKKREQTSERLIKARERMALEDYQEAISILRSLLAADAINVTAHVLLVRCLQSSGRLEEAIKASDDARARCKPNLELFLLAADVSLAAGNHTSALDNLSLALAHEPKSQLTLRRLVEVTVSLKRHNDAVLFQERLVKLLSGGEVYKKEQQKLAELELEELLSRSYTLNEKKSSLSELLKRHRNYSPALRALASCYLQDRPKVDATTNETKGYDLDEGLKLLLQAFKHDPNPKYLEEAALYALEASQPARALSLVNTAIEDAKKAKLDVTTAELLYVQLLVHLENNNEASERLNALDESMAGSCQYVDERKLLRAILLRHRGEYKSAIPQLTSLALGGVNLPSLKLLKAEIEESGSYVAEAINDDIGLAKPAQPFYAVP